ncbi:hypothetical protein [Deinococcus aquaedulcis]|uniref:hypothetical protein n=1 Tax=Deinococcus aquaedulcis TaxID=2840455 RepID=UPI001C82C229|nr:hypothetical protein [Deinococcus aquaedulcis]
MRLGLHFPAVHRVKCTGLTFSVRRQVGHFRFVLWAMTGGGRTRAKTTYTDAEIFARDQAALYTLQSDFCASTFKGSLLPVEQLLSRTASPSPVRASSEPSAQAPALQAARAKPLVPTTQSPGFVKDTDGSPRRELDSAQLQKARAWYAANAAQYTPAVLRQLQAKLGEPPTGKVTNSFLQKVADWQITFDLAEAAGRFIEVGDTLVAGYLPTGVLTPEQVSRLFPTGLARPAQVAAFAISTEETIAKWDHVGGYDGRRKLLATLLAHELKAAGILMPRFDLLKMDENSYGYYVPRTHAIVVNSSLLRQPDLPQSELRELCQTLYHEARHAEQTFSVARLLCGSGMTVDAAYQHTKIYRPLVRSAAAKPIRPASPEGIVANEWYQSRYGAFAAQRAADLNTKDKLALEVAKSKETLAALQARRVTLQQKLKTNLTATQRNEVTVTLNALQAEIKAVTAKLETQRQQHDVYYEKYRALPGERDAWDVEGAVNTYYLRHLEKP